jgi:hypothetical protein
LCWVCGRGRSPTQVRERSFDGDSRALVATKVVPTLDAVIDRQTNVVWCASFLAAWKVLHADVVKEPPSLQSSPAVALALNAAPDPQPHIPTQCLYVAAGWNQNGVSDRITKDLALNFPGKAPPAFPGILPDSFVAYAYLEANVKFTLPYFQNHKALVFTDTRGVRTELNSFGIRPDDGRAYFELRKQPRILYEVRDENDELSECVVDLDRTSTPNQIILALVTPHHTLAETVATVQSKIDTIEKSHGKDHVGPNDVLLVPDMVWRITHRFAELEGLQFTNSKLKGHRLDVAQQDIQLRLGRSGAEIKSEAKVYMTPIPTYYVFNRPFLLLIKSRDAELPYFVMWVENSELLSKWHSSNAN